MLDTNYDIFISFQDNNYGERTWASKKGEHIYNSLRTKGYNPFFSRVTMDTEIGESISENVDYALGTAKVMILVFSSFRGGSGTDDGTFPVIYCSTVSNIRLY